MNFKKTISVFGKAIPVWAIASLVMAGTASAALLTYYGQITGTFDVQQSILLDNLAWPSSAVTDTINELAPGGETFCFDHSLKNQMSVDGQVNLATTCSNDIPNKEQDCSGVTTTYLKVTTPAPDVIGDIDAVTPSTNSANTNNGWAHFNKLNVGVNSVQLDFVSTRPFYSCFEVRTDGNTNQVLTENGGNNYNTNIHDGLYPYYCEKNSNEVVTIPANGYIEVRMVFGAETDERFDWTKIYVSGSPLTLPLSIPSDQIADFAVCHTFDIDIQPGIYTITTNVVPA